MVENAETIFDGDNHMLAQPNNLALLTDLYEFTMAEAYYQSNMFAPATFSPFIHDVIEKELGES
jgi:nicotinic acid phosphoribosyltransferase